MSTDKNTDNGDIYPTAIRGEFILEFQEEVIEIEALLKGCLVVNRLRVSSSEVQSLIQEWKALYQRKIGEDISEEDFNKTEIGTFIMNHLLYENMEKLV